MEEIQKQAERFGTETLFEYATPADLAQWPLTFPTTHRDTNQSVLFLTGHDASGDVPSGVDWEKVTSASPVIVMYMAVRKLPEIARTMIGHGRAGDEPVAVISNASLPGQSVFTTTLASAADNPDIAKLPTPALVVIGKVVDFHATLDWYVQALRENPIG